MTEFFDHLCGSVDDYHTGCRRVIVESYMDVITMLQCDCSVFHSFNPWKRPHDFYFCFVKDKDKETMMNAPRMFITFDSK